MTLFTCNQTFSIMSAISLWKRGVLLVFGNFEVFHVFEDLQLESQERKSNHPKTSSRPKSVIFIEISRKYDQEYLLIAIDIFHQNVNLFE